MLLSAIGFLHLGTSVYHCVFIMTSHYEQHGLKHRVCSLTKCDRTVQENHCLIGQTLKTAGRYTHTVLDPGISSRLGNPVRKRCSSSGGHSQPLSQPDLAGGRMTGT